MPQCKNCQSGFQGTYCPTCGQRDIDLERPIWQLVGDVLKESLEVDGRAALSVKTLFRHPGKLTYEYLAGRRQSYTPPLRLYLAFSILFFVLVAWLARTGSLLEPGQDPGFDAAVQARFLSDDLPRLMFLLLPVFALLLKTVYPGRLYFDHLIFSLHLHSATYVILIAMLPLERLANQHIVWMILQVVVLVYFIVHLVTAMRRVYRTGLLGVAIRSTAVLIAYMMIVSIVIENTSSFMIIAD